MLSDDEIKTIAKRYARKNCKSIAKKLYDSVEEEKGRPTAFFMAGPPGAGKTESADELAARFPVGLRIDADELRKIFPDYDGKNASLFKNAETIVVDEVMNHALKGRKSFLFDSTMAHYERARKNIIRAQENEMPVVIFYVYQTPKTAWKLTQKREVIDGRKITHEYFVRAYLGSRETMKKLLGEFGGGITILLIKKDYQNDQMTKTYTLIDNASMFDELVGENYSEEELRNMIE